MCVMFEFEFEFVCVMFVNNVVYVIIDCLCVFNVFNCDVVECLYELF